MPTPSEFRHCYKCQTARKGGNKCHIWKKFEASFEALRYQWLSSNARTIIRFKLSQWIASTCKLFVSPPDPPEPPCCSECGHELDAT